MPYNRKLEAASDASAARWRNISKKKMFGGVCYLVQGTMAVGIVRDLLIVRMDKAAAARNLQGKNVRPFDITGRAMAGWIMVEEAGWRSAAGLAKWITIGKDFALSLPEKKGRPKAGKTRTLREYRGYGDPAAGAI
jgi:TfoX/Sxy family transcriptional regulator of competence genes